MSIFRDQSGKLSMMRVGFFAATFTGVMLCVAGAVAMFYDRTAAAAAMTAGAGLMAGTGWAKAVQSKYEVKQ